MPQIHACTNTHTTSEDMHTTNYLSRHLRQIPYTLTTPYWIATSRTSDVHNGMEHSLCLGLASYTLRWYVPFRTWLVHANVDNEHACSAMHTKTKLINNAHTHKFNAYKDT